MTSVAALRAEHLTRTYPNGHTAVDNVTLSLAPGECLGMVGESGSGKSTLARALLGLEPLASGRIWLDGAELTAMRGREFRRRRPRMQVVFQSAAGSFNPRLPIIESLLEPLACRPGGLAAALAALDGDRRLFAEELMRRVRLEPDVLDARPSALSGGQLQRVSIARALSVRPDVVILDEPTASLDVSIQARVLNLLKDLRDETGVAMLFITHDLAAARFMSDRLAVMQSGRIVDECDQDELFDSARHPYTRELVELFRTGPATNAV